MQSNKYKTVLLKRANIQFEKALNWYESQSPLAATGFLKEMNERMSMLQSDPYRYRNPYKQFYEVSLKKYPYLLIYKINDNKKQVVIVSVHHHKQNPKRKYKW